jgi:hypothetical protein
MSSAARRGGGGGKAPAEKERLRREIEATDRRIDQFVYDLYGLTPEEIRLVEATTTQPTSANAAAPEGA